MLSLVSQAPFTGVTPADLRSHLNITDTSTDAYLQALIDAAVAYGERLTGMDLRATTWALVLDGFPRLDPHHGGLWDTWAGIYPVWHHRHRHLSIDLERGPLQSVQAVTYYDSGGNPQVMTAGTDYYTSAPSYAPGWLDPVAGYWPWTAPRPDAVTVQFVSGFSMAPPQAVHAIKLLAGLWYLQREDLAMGPGTAGGQAGQAVETLLGQVRPGGYQ